MATPAGGHGSVQRASASRTRRRSTVRRMTMRHVAFLRGINVGKRRVKNDALSTVFDALGFENVRVLIASGNVAFDADKQNEATLTKVVEAGLEQALGFQVSVMLRSLPELRAMLDRDPFNGIEV